MKHSVVFATNNSHKIEEVQKILENYPIQLLSLAEAGITGLEEPVEDGMTYEANALIKARYYQAYTDLPVCADDSGFEVQAMNDAPGLYSARYISSDASASQRNERILAELQGIQDRKASFVCSAVLVSEVGAFTDYKVWDGEVVQEASGVSGFGYDPIFYVLSLGKTAAEMSLEEKCRYSHRGLAFRGLFDTYQTAISTLS